MQKYHNLQKNPLKEIQNPSRYYYYYYNAIITNLKFQHKPKYIILFQKSSYKNRPIIYYLGVKIPEATILYYNESKHNILALVGKANKKYLKGN